MSIRNIKLNSSNRKRRASSIKYMEGRVYVFLSYSSLSFNVHCVMFYWTTVLSCAVRMFPLLLLFFLSLLSLAWWIWHVRVFACVWNTGSSSRKKGGEEWEKKKKNLDSSVAIMFYPSGICLSERGWSKKQRKDRFFFLFTRHVMMIEILLPIYSLKMLNDVKFIYE